MGIRHGCSGVKAIRAMNGATPVINCKAKKSIHAGNPSVWVYVAKFGYFMSYVVDDDDYDDYDDDDDRVLILFCLSSMIIVSGVFLRPSMPSSGDERCLNCILYTFLEDLEHH